MPFNDCASKDGDEGNDPVAGMKRACGNVIDENDKDGRGDGVEGDFVGVKEREGRMVKEIHEGKLDDAKKRKPYAKPYGDTAHKREEDHGGDGKAQECHIHGWDGNKGAPDNAEGKRPDERYDEQIKHWRSIHDFGTMWQREYQYEMD